MKLLIIAIAVFVSCTAQSQGIHSGISGKSVLIRAGGPPAIVGYTSVGPSAYPTVVQVFSDKGKLVADLETDDDGNFRVSLKPGHYVLVPYVAPEVGLIGPFASPVDVTVGRFSFEYVEIDYIVLL